VIDLWRWCTRDGVILMRAMLSTRRAGSRMSQLPPTPRLTQIGSQTATVRDVSARPSWIHGPVRDTCLALCWVPLALAVHAVEGDHALLASALAATLLLSLSHQPVTLALIYGDREQFGIHPRLFTWTPLVAVAVVVVGLQVSFVAVALVAALWNAEHTLMQRFGLTRMYGRKAGDDHAAMERAMLLAWLALTVVVVAANHRTPRLLGRVDLGPVNQRGAGLLVSLRPEATALVPFVFALAVVLTTRWALAERRRGAAVNPAKYLYLAATAALLMVICIDPIAGLAAFVGAHALEYFSIVNAAVRRRSADGGGGLGGRLVRAPTGRPGRTDDGPRPSLVVQPGDDDVPECGGIAHLLRRVHLEAATALRRPGSRRFSDLAGSIGSGAVRPHAGRRLTPDLLGATWILQRPAAGNRRRSSPCGTNAAQPIRRPSWSTCPVGSG
jgi:hypothetical protein